MEEENEKKEGKKKLFCAFKREKTKEGMRTKF